MDDCIVVFGGSGFLGTHYIDHFSELNPLTKIYLVDLVSPEETGCCYRSKIFSNNARIKFVRHDVRERFTFHPPERVRCIYNFAAIHREPGHALFEYYETNISGAETVTDWAVQVGCETIVFSSSISPYGSSRSGILESSMPSPESPYGGSKLVAEKIHLGWAFSGDEGRKLIILRPGVIFGPSERGNVSRMIRAVRGRYFFYTGNRRIRKAGVYVRELCGIIDFLLVCSKKKANRSVLANVTMSPSPVMQRYVEAITQVLGVRRMIISVPFSLLLSLARILDPVFSLVNKDHPFKVRRVEKLVLENDVVPGELLDLGYEYKFTLLEAMSDWKKRLPSEWR